MTAPAKLSAAYLRQQVDAGARISEIARATGYTRATVTRHLRVHDISIKRARGPRRTLPSAVDLIVALRTGTSAMDLAKTYGTTRSAIVQALGRAGFKLESGKVVHDFMHGTGTLSRRIARVEDIERRVDLAIAAKRSAA